MPINSFLYPGVKVTPVFEVANSLRFDDGSSDYLNRTLGTPTSQRIFTISAWIKRGELTAHNYIIGQNSTNESYFRINSSDQLDFQDRDATTGASDFALTTNALLRDVSAWYHVVLSVDTTQATASDRGKLYINGVLQTLSASTYPPQNYDTMMNLSGATQKIGYVFDFFDGYMAEVVFIDGQALDPTSFGEFDADTGIWKPINVSGLTFGTNGFYLDFENSGSLGADVSGNGNNFTVNNLTSIDQTTDTPTNNYVTLNPLYSQVHTLSQGNLEYTSSTSDWDSSLSTIAVSSGKWYWETKLSSLDGADFRFYIGICDERDGNLIAKNQVGQNPAGRVGDTIGLIPDSGSPDAVKNGSSTGSWSTNSVNDIIGIAVDCDNGAVYFSKNGTFMNSGDPTSGASKTGGITFTTGQTYLMGVTVYGTGSAQQQLNFGNPPFTISSGNSDANGFGNFEYAVPSGYYALNTKNLAEFG